MDRTSQQVMLDTQWCQCVNNGCCTCSTCISKDEKDTRTQTALGYVGDACSAAGLFPFPFGGPFDGPLPGPLATTAGA